MAKAKAAFDAAADHLRAEGHEPVSTFEICIPMTVMIGISALPSACLKITWRSGAPFARAVRM